MVNTLDSVKKFVTILTLLVLGTVAVIFLFERLIAVPIKLPTLLMQSIETVIVVVSGSIVTFLIRRFKNAMGKRIGLHPATIFSFLMVFVALVITIFAALNIFQVSATTLLLGGGIVSLVVGLIISTLVGSMFAGTLVLMSNIFKVGDSVLVNNVPGRIEEITAMFTRIRNDVGGEIIIPNTALIQGSVIVTKIPYDGHTPQSRLPYSLGDRVYTTYMNEEGVVKEITPLNTKILLDSKREITFLNTSVMSGMIAIAKVNRNASELKPKRNKEGKTKPDQGRANA